MILFNAIHHFLQRIKVLKDVKRGVYDTVEDEIRSSFKGATIEEIRQNRDMILMDDEHIIIKLCSLATKGTQEIAENAERFLRTRMTRI